MKDGANSKQETHMNIHHFEQLMITFQEHVNEDGSSGMDIDKFREVFTDILGAHATYDQMTLLFMKIDANSDGSVDWDEFSTYMMAASNEENSSVSIVFDDRIRRLLNSPHKDMIKRIDFIQKDRKYISVGRDGTICIWSQKFKLQKILSTQDFFSSASWVGDAVFMQDSRKLAITTDRRQYFSIT